MPQSSKLLEKFLKIIALFISINWPSLVTCELWFKRYSKMQSVLCIKTHHDVTDLVKHVMVEKRKLDYLENGT